MSEFDYEGAINKPTEIDLEGDFGDVVVKAKGVRVEVHADRSVDTYTDSPVRQHPAMNDDGLKAVAAEPQNGDVETDGDHEGEIYGGIWSKKYGGPSVPT
jgi:hypothetical protein